MIAIQQNDIQYLIDIDVMHMDNVSVYNFTFSEFEMTPLMLACAIGK